MKSQLGFLLAATLALLAAGAPATGAGPTFTASQLRADLQEIKLALHEMPADLSHSVDPAALDRAIVELDLTLEKSPPLDRDAAWRLFATLNPLLADGHLFVGFVDWRADTRAHIAAGGTLFPFKVRMTAACELSVHQDPRSSHAYARIRMINGLPAGALCEQMLARVHGDTRSFRIDLLNRRFWFFYWKMFGAPESYELALDPGGVQWFKGNKSLPGMLEAENDFRRQFDTLYAGGDRNGDNPTTAIVSLGTFAWPDKAQVLEYTRGVFAGLKRWHIKTLIIDLRDNGGGNDDQWIEGVMPYIATKPWRTASTYRKRVVTPDPAKKEVAGAVVDGEIESWYQPQPDNPLRFAGDVYIAVGPGTYSSAVVMSTMFQDFGFGQVIGSGDSVRANQSGGTRRTTLTNTGLIVVAPRFVLRRPSGKSEPVFMTPDIPLAPEVSLADFSPKQGQ